MPLPPPDPFVHTALNPLTHMPLPQPTRVQDVAQVRPHVERRVVAPEVRHARHLRLRQAVPPTAASASALPLAVPLAVPSAQLPRLRGPPDGLNVEHHVWREGALGGEGGEGVAVVHGGLVGERGGEREEGGQKVRYGGGPMDCQAYGRHPTLNGDIGKRREASKAEASEADR